jgi:hypothetical protein
MYCDGSSSFGAGCPCTHPFYGVVGANYFNRHNELSLLKRVN